MPHNGEFRFIVLKEENPFYKSHLSMRILCERNHPAQKSANPRQKVSVAFIRKPSCLKGRKESSQLL